MANTIKHFSLELNEESLPMFEQIADGLPGAFFIYKDGGDGELIYYNATLISMLGCKSEESFRALTHGTYKGIVHPDDYEALKAEIGRRQASGNSTLGYFSHRILRRDRTEIWVDSYGSIMHTEQFGDIYYVFLDDATARKELEIERERIMQVAEGLCSDYYSVYVVDPETSVMVPYQLNNNISRSLENTIRTKQLFSVIMAEFALRYVVPEERSYFLREMTIPNLLEKLEHEPFYKISFHRYDEKRYAEFIQMMAARIPEDPSASLIVGFKSTSDELFKIHSNMNLYFKMAFDTVYYLDIMDDTGYVAFSKGMEIDNFSTEQRNAWNELKMIVRMRVVSEDQQRVLEFISKENLQKKLHMVGDQVKIVYSEIYGGSVRKSVMEISLLTKENRNIKNLLLTIRAAE